MKKRPAVEVGERKENSSESNNCKGNEFQNPEEDTSPRPAYLRGWVAGGEEGGAGVGWGWAVKEKKKNIISGAQFN